MTQLSPASEHHAPPSEPLFPDRNCCFCLSYRWRKVPSTDYEQQQQQQQPTTTLWSRGLAAIKKLREWSEIVAGPKWKTFIRRFNQSKSGNKQASKFQYDPLSYALNFDQGPLQNGDPETENEYMLRNFSSRYVMQTSASTGKGSMDVRTNEFV